VGKTKAKANTRLLLQQPALFYNNKGALSQGSDWCVITYHFNVSAAGYAKRRDISVWEVHPVKLQMYIPILIFHPIELSFGHVTHGT
jgi:hypothetical protein